eukprot:gene12191-25607_t
MSEVEKTTTVEQFSPMKKNRTIPSSLAQSCCHVLEDLSLPGNITVHYITTPEKCDGFCKEILRLSDQKWSVWGFDLEWRAFTGHGPGPVALMQLCREDTVILLQLSKCGMSKYLKEILMADNRYKVGLNISGDISKIKRDFPQLTQPIRGVCDLRDIYRAVSNISPPSSLAHMVEKLFTKNLPKPNNVRCSNWEKYPLSITQQNYAALDAYVSYFSYRAIFEQCQVQVQVQVQTPSSSTCTSTVSQSFLELPSNDRILYMKNVLDKVDINNNKNKTKIISNNKNNENDNENTEIIKVNNNDINYIVFDLTHAVCTPTPTNTNNMPYQSHSSKSFDMSGGFIREQQLPELTTAYTINQNISMENIQIDLTTEKEQEQIEINHSSILQKNTFPRLSLTVITTINKYNKFTPQNNNVSKSTKLKSYYYELWSSGKDFEYIAEERGVKIATVITNILNSIDEGFSYKFSLFDIDSSICNKIIKAYLICFEEDSLHIPIENLPSSNSSSNMSSRRSIKQQNLNIHNSNNNSGNNNNTNINTCITIKRIRDVFLLYGDTPPEYWKCRLMSIHLKRNIGLDWIEKLFAIENNLNTTSISNSSNSSSNEHATVEEQEKDMMMDNWLA